jgi:flavin reductase (DIM6/NTAB) family NADH-FMN oxidoreductase RutF
MQSRETARLQMRDALGRLAKAVVVITCHHEDRRLAMAATAVSEFSLDPPSLLICVNRNASLFAPLAAGADFCVNILHSSCETFSVSCEGNFKDEAQLEQSGWALSKPNLPYLKDTEPSFVCRNEMHIDYGTHGVFIGEVVGVMNRAPVDPLVYVDQRYAVVTGAR